MFCSIDNISLSFYRVPSQLPFISSFSGKCDVIEFLLLVTSSPRLTSDRKKEWRSRREHIHSEKLKWIQTIDMALEENLENKSKLTLVVIVPNFLNEVGLDGPFATARIPWKVRWFDGSLQTWTFYSSFHLYIIHVLCSHWISNVYQRVL